MIANVLPISDVIEVTVSAAAPAIPPLPFNQGLIVGNSTIIPSYGANSQIQQFASLTAMVQAGFSLTSPEYLAAELYFSQNPTPEYVWIGRQDATAIFSAIPHSGAAGTGYVVGDLITVVQGGASNGVLKVTTVGGGGVVTGLATQVGYQGTGYSATSGLTTTGGSGTGLEVDITAIGETLTQAVKYCALINNQWYGFMCCGAADADHLALAALSTANWETMFYFGATSDAAVVNGTASNIALQMQALKDRAVLMYSTTQSGVYPNNIYAAAAVLGLACGLNTGAPGSAFTLQLKPLVGVAPEPLSQTQWNTLQSQNCNACVTFGPYIGYFSTGVLPSGEFYDEILYRAMLVNQIQYNLMNLLISVPKIPQTDAGEHQLIAAVNQACQSLANIGYIGPGVWTGPTITVGSSEISNGQSLPNGFLSLAASFATQSAGARAARQAMPISTFILEAGAVHSVQVNVSVQI